MANEKVKELLGTWKHESSDNADAYYKVSVCSLLFVIIGVLQKVGIGMILRNVAKVQKPTVKITLDGDTWHIYIESAFKVRIQSQHITKLTFVRVGKKLSVKNV